MKWFARPLLAGFGLVSLLAAGEQGDGSTPKTEPAKPAAEAKPPASRQSRLGASAQRNENVAVYLIDTNAIKEANVRLGTTTTSVAEPTADAQYFAAEHGRPASGPFLLRPAARPQSWHGEGYWWHQNSVFNARTFFQVGPVKPSRRNFYGGRATGLVPGLGALTADFSQRHIRGMVNGNVQVPLADERVPLTKDPALAPIVQKFLNAYPKELPNRPDFDIRALNTNAPQRIDEVSGGLRLDRAAGHKSKLMLNWSDNRQRILAFQLVAGQNPNTELHNQRAGATWTANPTAATTWSFGAQFQRAMSLLVSEPHAVGPRVRVGFQFEELGPDSMFPIDRATNSFRYGAVWQHMAGGGRHALSAGGDFTRFQLNGIESNNQRGYYQFSSNFGRSAIENLRWGTPSFYDVAVGELSRGYRNWTLNAYVGDRWKLHPRLQLYYGLRWMADSRPIEVQGRETLPYSTDWNNFSPRLSFAWQAGRGFVVRAMYTTTFWQIQPVTYQQIRNNPPSVKYLLLTDPNLADPLHGLDLNSPTLRISPTYISGDLAAPYSHQYNFNIERKIWAGNTLRVSYIGSRSIKLLNGFVQNRANPVPGIPLTTKTADERRPDQRYSEIKRIVNGGVAYFDAGQTAWDLPRWRGLAASVSYTFSKAIDEGPDFSGTGANKDLLNSRPQWQYEAYKDRKGLSNFDSPHALQFSYAYEVPQPRSAPAWLRALAADWQIAGIQTWKKGTPMTLYIGSDAPGYGNVDGGPSDRPSILDPSILGMTIGDPNTAPLILRRDRFDFIHPGEARGNLGRGTFRKSSIWNWNAALTRLVRLRNEWSAQIRAEVYNLSNTPQFDEPQRNLSAPAFGKITNTLNDGRVYQLGFRLVF